MTFTGFCALIKHENYKTFHVYTNINSDIILPQNGWFCMFQCIKIFTTQSGLLTTLEKKPFIIIVGKEENAGIQHFLLFPLLLTVSRKFQFFSHIFFVVCKCF